MKSPLVYTFGNYCKKSTPKNHTGTEAVQLFKLYNIWETIIFKRMWFYLIGETFQHGKFLHEKFLRFCFPVTD